MKRAVMIRHLAFEDAGILAPVLAARGHAASYRDAGVDDLRDVALDAGDLLIVLGGPIGAHEDAKYPFLVDELTLLERALATGTAVLGLCLGAQLLARALGARVYPGRAKEIGIAPITLTEDGARSCLAHLTDDRAVLHWHGDTFDLPDGAARLASTAITPNQAFARGSALGLQFHIEAEPLRFERWLIGHTGELAAASIDVPTLRADAARQLPAIAEAGARAIDAWLAEVELGGAG